MEICHSIIMFFDITPNSHRMFMAAIKCSVHELNLRHFPVNKKL